MGYMKSVDAVFNEYKLSDAQKNAVVELLTGGFYTAKPNTIKSLENKGLIIRDTADSGKVIFHFEHEFHVKVKEAHSQPEPRETIQEIEELLQPKPANVVDREEIPQEVVEAKNAPESFHTELMQDLARLEEMAHEFPTREVFDSQMAEWERELMGFDFVSGWKGTEVWNGLTAAEIQEDMETARPVNREARRTHFRTLRNAFRRMNNQDKSRKSKKITGAVGL